MGTTKERVFYRVRDENVQELYVYVLALYRLVRPRSEPAPASTGIEPQPSLPELEEYVVSA